MKTIMENYFKSYRENTIGNDHEYQGPYGKVKMVYADWVAGGRLYLPIEKKLINDFGPFVANTHSEASETGILMTKSYHKARDIIKSHVNANKDDILITAGFGMTSLINKLQRILGLKLCGKISNRDCLNESERPVVFLTHMEHHSNHTSWFETSADIVLLEPGKDMLVDLNNLEKNLIKYQSRKLKIGSFTACSNVTGIRTPYYEMAKLMHKHNGICIIDFAASAPYEAINMHPSDPSAQLDAILFSPHKFLGGPGSSGVLVFNKHLYQSKAPDNPGGGTVNWTNPWGEYSYIEDIEIREDGGTPGYLQAIKTALTLKLKDEMQIENMHNRENILVHKAFEKLSPIKGLHILAGHIKDRLGIISFYIENIHYNLIVKLLSDRYGIQVRGGCVCAGTYGHYLLNVSYELSRKITDRIDMGDLSLKPGWVRLSLHPTMTDNELDFVAFALSEIVTNINVWKNDYSYSNKTNEFTNIHFDKRNLSILESWFAF